MFRDALVSFKTDMTKLFLFNNDVYPFKSEIRTKTDILPLAKQNALCQPLA